MLRDDGGYLLAVIPASELLDVHKVRRPASRRHVMVAWSARWAIARARHQRPG